ncbi:hypothetical protein [Streptomyces sp. NPDC047990]|uniref:hypothetical protein n=1 Tax=Streptomyces sp. NPDC047990 TaxID=3365496 RepID=UPI0037199299
MDDAGRYRLTLSLDSRPAMTGWWDDRPVADRQFSSWVGERGEMPGVRIELIDTADDRVIHRWPGEA